MRLFALARPALPRRPPLAPGPCRRAFASAPPPKGSGPRRRPRNPKLAARLDPALAAQLARLFPGGDPFWIVPRMVRSLAERAPVPEWLRAVMLPVLRAPPVPAVAFLTLWAAGRVLLLVGLPVACYATFPFAAAAPSIAWVCRPFVELGGGADAAGRWERWAREQAHRSPVFKILVT